MIEHRGYRILLPGDVESKQPLPFLSLPPEHADILVAPHHGSIKPSTDALTTWTTPNTIIISGGLFTYKPDNKKHFEQSGSQVYETLYDGMVETVIDKNGIRVRKWRK